MNGADVVNLRSHVDAESRHMLFRGSAVVLANSAHEPFGLVGLETMAAGGIACTGCSGEDYAVPGRNALVLETNDPREFLSMFSRLRTHPREAQALRRAGRRTARRFAWPEIVQRVLMPRVELSYDTGAPKSAPIRPVLRTLPRKKPRANGDDPIVHSEIEDISWSSKIASGDRRVHRQAPHNLPAQGQYRAIN